MKNVSGLYNKAQTEEDKTMKKSQFDKEYEERAQQALEHHLKVLELAYKLPSDEFEQFYWQERETYFKVLKELLIELERKMKGIG